jgi:tetratricopeptide (TPR) repeat protein
MDKVVRLRRVLLQLVVATSIFSTMENYALAQTDREPFFWQRKSVFLAQTSAEDFLNRGSSLFQQKRYQEALASYDKAIQIRPDHIGT